MAKKGSQLVGLVEIIKQVLTVPRRNKKIFLFVILSNLIPYTLLTLGNTYSTKGLSKRIRLSTEVIPPSTDPKNPEFVKQTSKLQQDAMLFLLVEIIFSLVQAVVSLLSMVAAVYVSAMSYLGKDLTVKDLCLKIKKIWTRPLITSFYVCLLGAGFFLLISMSIVPIFTVGTGSVYLIGIGSVLSLLAICIGIYFALIWMVSVVISVLEDRYGLEALVKAGKLAKGRKVVGILLIVGFFILSAAISSISGYHQNETIKYLIMFVTAILGILVKIISMTAYTLFYFERKHSHGEEVEVEQDMGYTMVSTIPIDREALLP